MRLSFAKVQMDLVFMKILIFQLSRIFAFILISRNHVFEYYLPDLLFCHPLKFCVGGECLIGLTLVMVYLQQGFPRCGTHRDNFRWYMAMTLNNTSHFMRKGFFLFPILFQT